MSGIIPTAVFIVFINAIFNPFGTNLILDLGIFKIYSDTIINSAYYSASMISVILWCSCKIADMSVLSQFKIFPKLSLMIYFVMNSFSNVKSKLQQINRFRKLVGEISPKKSVIKKIRYTSQSLYLLFSETIKNSLYFSSSLESVGYQGQYVPIAIQNAKFDLSDKFLSFIIIGLSILCIILHSDPNINKIYSLLTVIILFLIPISIKAKENFKWIFLK